MHTHPYLTWLERKRPSVFTLREPVDFHDPIPVTERLVQVIWADQLFDTRHLRTRDQQSLEIIRPGRWNSEGGPDFSGAQILINGRECTGDIEVHLNTGGWHEHRHALNPEYNQTILDVCLWDTGGPVIMPTQKGDPVLQLVLHPHLECSLDELAESLDPDAYPYSPIRISGRPCPLLQLPRDEVVSYIRSAGMFRFEKKIAQAKEAITREGENEAAYQLLAEALGYKNNKQAFRRIAQMLPLSELQAIPSMDAKIGALLSPTQRDPLKFRSTRPSNHPERRLAALALLAHEYPHLSRWFMETLQHPSSWKAPPPLEHFFWSWHYHSRAAKLSKPLALLGQSRWMDILANVLLPFCSAQASQMRDRNQARKILETYQHLANCQSNVASRQIAHELGIRAPTSMLEQQGLIQIYHDFEIMAPEPQASARED